MSEERVQVLKLLEQGRITYEEALALLQALGDGGPAGKRVDPVDRFKSEERSSLLAELGQELREMGEEVASEIREAVEEIREELENGKEISVWLQGLLGGNPDEHYSWQETRVVPIDGEIKELNLYISNKNGNFRLLATNEEQLTARLSLRVQADSEEEARQLVTSHLHEHQEETDDQLELSWRVGEQIRGSISFEILIPRRLLAHLRLVSKNGSISIEDLEIAGRIETKNGSIKVTGRTHNDLELETKNGSIAVTAAVGTLTATTKNGTLHATLEPICTGTLSLTTTNGAVHAQLAGGDTRAYELDLQTRNGRASADLPGFQPELREKNRVSGVTDNWEQAAIRTKVVASSKNGNISINSH
ncbi:MAG: DUF4097 family beta strand repeat protein [Firmicutes bacterium]|nr:DUF4097 family beta strand repeat protein [Bacillota bacterium]